MSGAVSEFLGGVGLIARGASLLLRTPRLFVLGALPPLISSLVFLAVMIILAFQAERIVLALTPFLDTWNPGLAAALRVLAGVALLAGAALVLIITFSTLTLTLGSPLYDKISEAVDRQLGPLPVPREETFSAGLGRNVRQSLALIGTSALVAPLLFVAGFVPAVGQTVVPVTSAVFGGWTLCTELVGSAFERRGLLSLAERRSAMRTRRARVLGFSVPVFLLMAVPLAAIVIFPVATAGATVLARQLLEGRGGAVLPRTTSRGTESR